MKLTKIEIYVDREDGVKPVEAVYDGKGSCTGGVYTGWVDISELCKRWRSLPAVAVRLLTEKQGEDITDAGAVLEELGYARNVGGNVRRGYNWVLRNFTHEGTVMCAEEIFNALLGMSREQLKI